MTSRVRNLLVVAASLVLFLGCGGEGPKAPPDDVCDGSSEMRLVFEVGGGFVDSAFYFTNPHGFGFFAIDGSCRFYAGSDYMLGIASGTLSEGQAKQLGADVHWSDLAGWSWSYHQDETCPDAGGEALMRAGRFAGCGCGCDAIAPKGLGAALSNAEDWMRRLSAQGTRLDGPVTAFAWESDDPLKTDPRLERVTWPLARSMASIAGLLHERFDADVTVAGTTGGARFEDRVEVAQLRDVRFATAEQTLNGVTPTFVPVMEGSMRYDLYVRDELPETVEAAWDDLKATLPPP